MLRLKDTRHSDTASFLDSAIRVAQYYGFKSLDESRAATGAEAQSEKRRRQPSVAECEAQMQFARKDERSLVTSAKKCLSRLPAVQAGPPVRQAGLPAAPAHAGQPGVAENGMFLFWRTATGSGKERSIPGAALELHVIGSSGAIAEALLLVVASAIAAEAGVKRCVLSINNIGSPDSSNRFVRDVGHYLRKHIDSISPTLRPKISGDPLGALVQLIERGHPAMARAPQSMEYLTEEERRRFWELLEYLEVFGLPYELNPQVLGSRDCWAHALFEISTVDEESGVRIRFAWGGRYDPLASRFAPTPAAMISLVCEVRGRTRARPPDEEQPTIYLAHLGSEARRRVLSVLEILRLAKIPVHQSLLYDRLGEQMAAARRLAVPYVLIMGHKEAVESTVIVREVSTNSQDAVPVAELPQYLRRKHIVA